MRGFGVALSIVFLYLFVWDCAKGTDIVSTSTFDFTGSDQFVIPPGTEAYIYMWGAGGGKGNTNSAPGGAGAYVEGLLSGLIPGHNYTVVVGEGAGPYGGGGAPGRQDTLCIAGAHGGGRSAIAILGGDIVTAGGGGGALRDHPGGAATSFLNSEIEPVSFQGCIGGERDNDFAGTCGGGGNQTYGGRGGQTFGGEIANNGAQYSGANATCLSCIGLETPTPTAGGGGGGGYFGGGAGCTSGGGGGGSSFMNTAVLSNFSNSQGASGGSSVGSSSPFFASGYGSGLPGAASQNGRVVMEFYELAPNTPSLGPTLQPSTATPSHVPTRSPTAAPTLSPTSAPTAVPSTATPTAVPSTAAPTLHPTCRPTARPTTAPSQIPTPAPTTYRPTLYFPTSYPTPLNAALFTEININTLGFICGMLVFVSLVMCIYIIAQRARLTANLVAMGVDALAHIGSMEVLLHGCSFAAASTGMLLLVNCPAALQVLLIVVRAAIATNCFVLFDTEALRATTTDANSDNNDSILRAAVCLFALLDPSSIRLYMFRATIKTERYSGFPTYSIFRFAIWQHILNCAMGIAVAVILMGLNPTGVQMMPFEVLSFLLWSISLAQALRLYRAGLDGHERMIKGKRVIGDSSRMPPASAIQEVVVDGVRIERCDSEVSVIHIPVNPDDFDNLDTNNNASKRGLPGMYSGVRSRSPRGAANQVKKTTKHFGNFHSPGSESDSDSDFGNMNVEVRVRVKPSVKADIDL